MNEIRTLMEKFWICRDSDKETFYKVKRDIPNFQRFIREQLGWKLIHTEKLLKLEKRPAHAEAFMGISEFTDIRDYCILCVVLMYQEDAEEGRQFLLSDVLSSEENQVGQRLEQDAERASLRRSVEQLSPRERQIMELRFGLLDGVERTQKEVADAIGISQSYISRLEKRIIRQLREQLGE